MSAIELHKNHREASESEDGCSGLVTIYALKPRFLASGTGDGGDRWCQRGTSRFREPLRPAAKRAGARRGPFPHCCLAVAARQGAALSARWVQHLRRPLGRADRGTVRRTEAGRNEGGLRAERGFAETYQRSHHHRLDAWRRTGQRAGTWRRQGLRAANSAGYVGEYQRIRAADPTRPVMVNPGQGVAWDDYNRGINYEIESR